MTDYFEVHERDAAARLGELRLAESVRTPALVGERDGPDADVDRPVQAVLRDAGSEWPEAREQRSGDEETVTILPHRGFPAGTPDEVQDAFAPDYPDVAFPNGVVVSTETAADYGADVTVLAGAPGIVGHGRAFVDTVTTVREAIPADSALYLPGVATPANVATLVSAGVDLVDADRAVVRGTEGMYLTTDGAHFLEDLAELPCACSACQQPRETFDRADCVEHNVNALAAALRTVRHRIGRGRLRDYLEGQARHEQWLTATMRLLDEKYGYLERRTPLVRRNELTAASGDTLHRVEIQRFARRVTERYRARFDAPLVLLPCSAAKPYSDSQSHRQFTDAIAWRGHVVSMTSPIGVVPSELELTYPAQHYDSVVTGEWSDTEIGFVADVLSRYLDGNDYPELIAHVPADYRPICERVADERGVEFTYTVTDHPTTDESLAALSEALAGYESYRKREREHNTIRAIADYQFGAGAGDDLFTDFHTRGHYPGLQAHAEDGTQLATIVKQYGVLSLTLAGARRWVDSDVPTKRVEIDAFVPHGSVLAPGVVDADEDIRVGDDVVIEGPKAFAVGRAQMHGREMLESSRGVASEVRHVEET
jgi:archaeosine synthase